MVASCFLAGGPAIAAPSLVALGLFPSASPSPWKIPPQVPHRRTGSRASQDWNRRGSCLVRLGEPVRHPWLVWASPSSSREDGRVLAYYSFIQFLYQSPTLVYKGSILCSVTSSDFIVRFRIIAKNAAQAGRSTDRQRTIVVFGSRNRMQYSSNGVFRFHGEGGTKHPQILIVQIFIAQIFTADRAIIRRVFSMCKPKLSIIAVSVILSAMPAFASERSHFSDFINGRPMAATQSTDPSSPLKTPLEGRQYADKSCSSEDGSATCTCDNKCTSSKSDCQCED